MTSPAIDVADFRTRETEQLEKRVEQLLNRNANTEANLSLLCRSCHEWKHANPNAAHKDGWMVRQWEAPETVPLTDLYGQRFLFDGAKRVDL